jgi:hypothetical protein
MKERRKSKEKSMENRENLKRHNIIQLLANSITITLPSFDFQELNL